MVDDHNRGLNWEGRKRESERNERGKKEERVRGKRGRKEGDEKEK